MRKGECDLKLTEVRKPKLKRRERVLQKTRPVEYTGGHSERG